MSDVDTDLEDGTLVRALSPPPGPVGHHPLSHSNHREIHYHSIRSSHGAGLPALRLGVTDKSVRWLQILLNEQGASAQPLKVDSYFGPQTHAAVVRFQRSLSLSADGIVGKETWERVVVVNQRSRETPASIEFGAAVHTTAANVADWSLNRRFEEVLRMAPDYMRPELATQFRALLTPVNVGIMVVALCGWAVSHAFGAGEVADIVMGALGTIFLGWGAITAVEDLGDCLITTLHAEDQADLANAADYLAKAVAILGVITFFAMLAKVGAGFGRGASAAAEKEAAPAIADTPGKPAAPSDAPVEDSVEDESEHPAPSQEELAASPGNSPAQIAARQQVARSFYENAGMGPEDIDSHVECIDTNQPVKVVSVPPDGAGPNGDQLYQWSTPGKTGQYFTTDPAVTPDQLGTDSNVAVNGQIVPRVQNSFTANQPMTGLQSTAAPAADTWSVPGQTTQTSGGGTQIFVPRGSQTGLSVN